VLLSLSVAACAEDKTPAPNQRAGYATIRVALGESIANCTSVYGYDPFRPSTIAENKIAPKELPWRQCAYDAGRKYAEAHPSLRSLYDQLVSEDISMTTAIQQGQFTRTARRERLDNLLDRISKQETALIQGRLQHERDIQLTRDVIRSLRAFT
jgi:hypothetical protein